MRIAIPVSHDQVSETLSSCEFLRFYEDDHGRILRQFDTGPGEDMLEALERRSVDALVCKSLEQEERAALLSSGIPVFPGYEGNVLSAAERFLSSAVASDPANTCNACGWRDQCSGSCPLHP